MKRSIAIALFGVFVACFCGCRGGELDLNSKAIDDDFCHGLADGTPCNDGNPCTDDDRCGLGICKGHRVDDGTACDDGDPCTVEEMCATGVCLGSPMDCAALDSDCAQGMCQPETGECTADPVADGIVCDDSDLCTDEDSCQAGSCTGTPADCSDLEEPCKTASCDAQTGQCVTEPVPTGESCDDDSLCTVDDQCKFGECKGEDVDCSTMNGPCQAGVCDPTDGLCVADVFPNGTVCDDGNSCTDEENCSEGICGGGIHVPDGELCDDDDECTDGDVCLAGACQGEGKDCSGVTDSPCMTGVCDSETGECKAEPIEDPACVCWDAPNGTACDDGQNCTHDDTCSDNLCIGQALECSSYGDECNEGVCSEETGKCTKSPINFGKPCDDGFACTDFDKCKAGGCEGDLLDCSHMDGPCALGFCDEELGNCDAKKLTDDTPCDDGDICTGHDHCTDGECGGDFDLCAACFDEDQGNGCGDGNACTVNTVCIISLGQLVCIGEEKDCPEMMGQCSFGACDSDSGDCEAHNMPDGISCDDGDLCTVMDTCDSGDCVGISKECNDGALPCAIGSCNPDTGKCSFEPIEDGAQCDDSNPCTLEDTCIGGNCAGALKDCGDVEGPCMVGECDAETGECGIALEDGVDCNDFDPCTTADSCVDGECIGKDICFCLDKEDGTPCNDGYPCTVDDTCVKGGCDGTPKDCSDLAEECHVGVCIAATGECSSVPVQDGSPCADGNKCTAGDSCLEGLCGGTAIDCSQLDGDCGIGICKEGTGECTVDPAPDETPCDDADVCTGNDLCQNGSCQGDVNLCGDCADKQPGDECDDTDACTVNTICVEMSALLVCQGEPKDCSDWTDQCNLGGCDKTSGECGPKPIMDDTPCDDVAPCTFADVCSDGACTGTPIDMCGDNPHACEAPTDNSKLSEAVPLQLQGDSTTVMGWIDPEGETDWYSVALEEGQLLTVETRPHCQSSIDTQIGVYEPDGITQLAVADDGGQDKWTLIDEAEVQTSGLHYIGLTAYAETGTGTYLLDVAAFFPPPCESNVDCDCNQLECVFEGPQAGQCIPKMPIEVEPNSTPQTAMLTEVDSQVKGAFEPEGDIDWYKVVLQAGLPINLHTGSFCDEETDPVVTLYDELGINVLASNADAAGGGHALIEDFQPAVTGAYLIKVVDEAAGTGAYVLGLEDARCKSDNDCDCEDQTCDGDANQPGQCVPKLTAPEPGENDPPNAPIVLGQRLHSSFDAPYDLDTFAVSLAPGLYNFTTAPYCGSDTDTEMSLNGPSGEVIATDEDGCGVGFFACITGIQVDVPATYIIELTAYGAGVGEYILTVENAEVD